MLLEGGPEQGNLSANSRPLPVSLELGDGTPDAEKSKTMLCQSLLDKPSSAAPSGNEVRPHLGSWLGLRVETKSGGQRQFSTRGLMPRSRA